jgi:hypothetical protein
MVVPDSNLVPGELAEAWQGSKRIEVVVEYRDLHRPIPPSEGNVCFQLNILAE